MRHPANGLLAQVPAQLEAADGEDGGVDDGHAGLVGRGPHGEGDRSERTETVDAVLLRGIAKARDQFGLALGEGGDARVLGKPGPRVAA